MRRRTVRLLAAFVLAASASGSPALAGSPHEGTPAEQRRDVAPPPVRRAPAGLFNCSSREQRTKLERKNCGGTRF